MKNRKGFTLLELLIVMVIVGVLVTMALPKYQTAIEKGRGMEAIQNAAALSEAANVYYVKNNNSYGDPSYGRTGSVFMQDVANTTSTSKYFTPSYTWTASQVSVTLARSGISRSYSIVFVNKDGEVEERYCSGDERYCKALGASTARSGGGWNF